ncbi:hypothetical protein B0A52_00144 [Exophiala mesophila]|uniref:Shikimate dehydrogenase substrate binding N-terminal domain-containing protein n=1 Tax=Exophiala mesophila TaxID=212818 RepID=A0A438NJ78_EXOME|nr:hypothetical protein B0A52_00144 [Exophiala mesophila]
MSILDPNLYGKSTLQPSSKSECMSVYLFGGHISKSLSPLINMILFKSAGLPWTYGLCETTDPKRFQEVVGRLDCIGASVTMPNKVAFMPLLDDLTEEARCIGAVNTVFIRLDQEGRRRYIGTNTDCIGIRDTIMNNLPTLAQEKRSRPALVIGAGGAARSAIYALWRWFGPSEIYLVNRLKSEIDDLVAGIQSTIPGIRLRHIVSLEDQVAASTPQIIVGTVPDGVPSDDGEITSWRICEAFIRGGSSKGAVLDMCYHPARTRLLALAEANGWSTMLGTEVLVRVNVAQQRLWTEQDPDPKDLSELFLAIRQANEGDAKL